MTHFVMLTVKLQVGSTTVAEPGMFNVAKIDSVITGPNGSTRLFTERVDDEYFVIMESPKEVYKKIIKATMEATIEIR